VNSSQLTETDVQVASIRNVGTAMEGWDTVTGEGSWTPAIRGTDTELPPLRLEDA
jgi:hypothetical protein